MALMAFAAIGIGAAIGAWLRWGLGLLLNAVYPAIPLGTLAANLLGLGNSATALGLKAMQELQRLNPSKKVASNAMATFLAINTSSVTLIPATVIAVRSSAGSQHPSEILGAVILATSISTTVAVLAAKILQRLPIFRMKPEDMEAPRG